MTNESSPKPLTHIQFIQIQKSYSKNGFGIFNQTKSPNIILNNAEIQLKGGECRLLTGKNGSGKSTLLRILAGLLKPNSAIVNTGLESLTWKKANKLIRQNIMYLYQEPYMFDGTVKRNLAYAVRDGKSDYQIEQALKWANLEHRTNTSAKCLSGGERQRVALAQAWLKQPSVLLLDEPTANMDEESRQSTEDLLRKFKDSGTALLIASHDINHFHQTMDKHLLLENGLIIDISNEDSFKKDNEKIQAYDNISIFPKQNNLTHEN